jgi:hypothetical protein
VLQETDEEPDSNPPLNPITAQVTHTSVVKSVLCFRILYVNRKNYDLERKGIKLHLLLIYLVWIFYQLPNMEPSVVDPDPDPDL